MKIMSPKAIVNYFMDTFEPMHPEHWLEVRKTKVTASEVGCLIGYNKWKTAFDIYEEKVLGKRQPTTITMERGKYMEPLIAEEYKKRTGAIMYAPFEWRDGERWERLLEHPTDERRASTPDYFAVTDVLKYVEIKDVSYYGQVNWKDGMPEGYHLQIQYNLNIINSYLRILGQEPITCDLAYFWNDHIEIIPDIKEDPEKVDIIAKIATEFFDNHVTPRIYPIPERWQQAKIYYSGSDPDSVIESNDQMDNALYLLATHQDRLKDLKTECKLLEDIMESNKLQIAQYMGENQNLVSLGEVIATWKPDKNGNRVFSPKYGVIKKRIGL